MNKRKPNEGSKRYAQLQRWNEIAEDLGYKQGFTIGVYTSSISPMLFDHGGIVTRQDGQKVLFGDLYEGAWEGAAEFANKYGLELTVMPGLWYLGVSRLHLYRVIDPVKALRIYNNRPLGVGIWVKQAKRYMPVGTDMNKAKDDFEDFIRNPQYRRPRKPIYVNLD